MKGRWSFDYVRRTYGVPAARGMRVTVDGKLGTITVGDGAHIRVRFDGEEFSRRCHPTWRVVYGYVAPTRCPSCNSSDVTQRSEPCQYRGCWSCGLFFGQMTEQTEEELRARGYTQFDLTRPESGAPHYIPYATLPGGQKGGWVVEP